MKLVDRPTTQPTPQMLCHYYNSTHKMQLVRVVDSDDYSEEKLVFPNQRILFSGINEGRVEVYSEHKGKKVLEKILYCYQLQTMTTSAKIEPQKLLSKTYRIA